jgi:hypothetical protein
MTGKNEGIVVSGGNVRAGHLAVGRGARVDAMDIGSGSNVNVGSSLTGMQQTAGEMAAGGGAEEQDLAALLEILTKILNTTPTNKSEESEALAAQAAQLVEAAGKDHPNRTMLQVISGGLKQTAEFLKDAVPAAVKVTGQILDVVARLHGLSV